MKHCPSENGSLFMWFFVFVIGEILVIPLYWLSVEHTYLKERFGQERGIRIGDALGMISGWGFFGFWIGIWFSPQPTFVFPLYQELSFAVPIIEFSIPLFHLVLSLFFLIPGVWLGIEGVREIGLEAAEKHRSKRVITSGIYARVRHPQYLGGLLSHMGISLLISGLYSLLITPFMILVSFVYCWKEEIELTREFGMEYIEYAERVPMFIPRLHAFEDS